MPPVAKLLSIFTEKIKPKGSFILLSISPSQMSPAIKSIVQSIDLSLIVVAGRRKTLSSGLTRDLFPISAYQQLTNNGLMTDQYCTISYQFFWLESWFWSGFIVNLSLSYLFIDFMKFYQVLIDLIMFFFCFSDVVAIDMKQVLLPGA